MLLVFLRLFKFRVSRWTSFLTWFPWTWFLAKWIQKCQRCLGLGMWKIKLSKTHIFVVPETSAGNIFPNTKILENLWSNATMLQSPAFGLLEAKCWPVRIDLTAVLGSQMDGSLSGLGKCLPRNTMLTCLYSCKVVHPDSTNVSSCFKIQSCLPCNVGNFGQLWWLEWLKSLECTTSTVLLTPNFSMKQRCLWPVQLYTGHLLVPETLHDSISRLAVCSVPSGLWRVFADRVRAMEMPQGSYIMIFFKMLLGAWCHNLLLDVTGANRNYGVSWRKGALLTRVSQGTPDTIYHQNHELFISCCVKSVWMIASVCLHSCSFLFWLAKLFVS